MDIKEWEDFELTGKIESYLKYKGSRTTNADNTGQRRSAKGTGHRGVQ